MGHAIIFRSLSGFAGSEGDPLGRASGTGVARFYCGSLFHSAPGMALGATTDLSTIVEPRNEPLRRPFGRSLCMRCGAKLIFCWLFPHEESRLADIEN